ncbi:hydrogenase expression/formation protein HypE [Candidatus Fermentibacterales bacterium]|nr:hydrogenase expression/formation protein HypE [Candidatus Fermentibacterales bacterium]
MTEKRTPPDGFVPACPVPIPDYPRVTLAHGGGGRLMHDLIERMFVELLDNELLGQRHDGAVVPPVPGSGRIAITTDSYVVSPLFFPGGDIGSMAVYGTVNDLSMCAAHPSALTLGLILEEGLEMELLWRIVQSIAAACRRAGVVIATGDTKVVEHGSCDGIYINTAGIGTVPDGLDPPSPRRVRPGDSIVLSGDLGRHGIAVMAARQGIRFDSPVRSDLAPLNGMVSALIERGIELHCLRDLTRGGLGSALNEIATAGITLTVDEALIPISEPVRGACEILGFDPLYVANEGRFIAIVPESAAEDCVRTIGSFEDGREARVVGRAIEGRPLVTMKSMIGPERVLDMLSGEQLPRIC